jgi:hypothetical protein
MASLSLPASLSIGGAALAGAAMVSAVGLDLSSARAAAMGAPKALPYADAVSRTHDAAEAVLAGAGVESCLRGKLTNALLGLSSSCEASGDRNPLCQLADKAVVVTPMSLAFMRDTSTQLLALIKAPAAGSPQGAQTQPPARSCSAC